MAVTSNMTLFLVLLMAIILLYFAMRSPLIVENRPGAIPTIPSKIPFIGHILGIMRHKNQYYVKLRAKYSFPIYSLDLLGTKMYVVNSPDLMVSVQRNWKNLQLAPIASRCTARICHLSPQANSILMDNANLEKGDWGLYFDTLKGIHATLAFGEGLEQMTRVAIENVALSLDGLRTDTGPVRLNLVSWLRHEITLATSEAIYGPANPLRDLNVEDGFWALEDDLTMLVVDFLPALTAPKGHRGRAVCVEAFKNYFTNKGHETGSSLVKARIKAAEKYAISVDDIARLEVAGTLAVLENTMPTAFWMLFYVFSNPSILADLRLELKGILLLQTTTEPSTPIRRIVDLSAMKDKCPLLSSIFQETLRHRACGVSTREVVHDTSLNDQYQLKAGSIIQMPARVLHADPSIWGPTTAAFDPRRFLLKRSSNPKPPPPSAFRAFGGGTTLCPGRHLARMEVLAAVAMMVLRFDVEPVGGGWCMPRAKDDNIVASVAFPEGDVEVDVVPAEGAEGGSWAFQLAGVET